MQVLMKLVIITINNSVVFIEYQWNRYVQNAGSVKLSLWNLTTPLLPAMQKWNVSTAEFGGTFYGQAFLNIKLTAWK